MVAQELVQIHQVSNNLTFDLSFNSNKFISSCSKGIYQYMDIDPKRLDIGEPRRLVGEQA